MEGEQEETARIVDRVRPHGLQSCRFCGIQCYQRRFRSSKPRIGSDRDALFIGIAIPKRGITLKTKGFRLTPKRMGWTNRGSCCFNTQIAQERSKHKTRQPHCEPRYLVTPEKWSTAEHNDYLNNLEKQFVLQTLVPHLKRKWNDADQKLCQKMSTLWSRDVSQDGIEDAGSQGSSGCEPKQSPISSTADSVPLAWLS